MLNKFRTITVAVLAAAGIFAGTAAPAQALPRDCNKLESYIAYYQYGAYRAFENGGWAMNSHGQNWSYSTWSYHANQAENTYDRYCTGPYG